MSRRAQAWAWRGGQGGARFCGSLHNDLIPEPVVVRKACRPISGETLRKRVISVRRGAGSAVGLAAQGFERLPQKVIRGKGKGNFFLSS
jgi:hypothetical protein